MNTKQKIRLILFLSLLITTTVLGTCYGGFRSLCGPGVNEGLAIFLILFGSVVFLLSFIFSFVHEQKFTSWLNFAKYYIPIAAILIFLFPAVDSSILGFDREFMTWVFSGLFFIASLGMLIFSTKGGKRQSKTPDK